MSVRRDGLTACRFILELRPGAACRHGRTQLYMLQRLSEIYEIPFSENRGKSILTSLAGAMAPASVATATGSFIKGLPGIGTVIGALTMPVASAGATWVIGKVFIQHFASGGTLLDFNPPDYREFIKVQKAKVAARTRALPPHNSLGKLHCSSREFQVPIQPRARVGVSTQQSQRLRMPMVFRTA
jgi:uncharacterized protein (DUF697 family)